MSPTASLSPRSLRPSSLVGRRILYVDNRIEYVRSHRGVWLRAAVDAGLEVHVATISPGDCAELGIEGVRCHSLLTTGEGRGYLQAGARIRNLRRLYRSLSPDIVHHITLRAVAFGSVAGCGLGERSFVNSVTGLGYLFSVDTRTMKVARNSLLSLLRWTGKRTRPVYVFQNPDDEMLFRSRGVVNGGSHVIRGSGVELSVFQHTPESKGGIPVVVFPARMLWEKGVREFLDAARILKRAGEKARFALVGGLDADNPGGIGREQVEEWQNAGVIEWWGHQSDMARVFAMCHVVCLPSRYREGVPRALIEAASSGRPIVTTDMPGCREIVVDGKNGFLVPPGDAVRVAQAIRLLLRDPDLRERMGSIGRSMVERSFSAERVTANLLSIYAGLLDGKGTQTAAVSGEVVRDHLEVSP